MEHHESLARGESSLFVGIKIDKSGFQAIGGVRVDHDLISRLSAVKKKVFTFGKVVAGQVLASLLVMGAAYISQHTGVLLSLPPGIQEALSNPIVQSMLIAIWEIGVEAFFEAL